MIRTALLCWVLGALMFPAGAVACAVCACGDPTLTAFGVEQPYRGRIRLSLEWRYRTDHIGRPQVSEIDLVEHRVDAQLAWAPWERLFLLATVPTVSRQVSYINLARDTSIGLGDVELRAKFFLFRDRAFAPQHLIGVVGGIKLPTAPLARNADGRLLPIELQAGTGSIDPIAGLSYAHMFDPWSFYVSMTGSYPTRGTEGFRASPSLRSSTTLQYQLLPWLSPRLGVDTRLDGKAQEAGVASRDSGGFIVFVSPELLLSPVTDVMFYAALRIPVINALSGFHREGAFANIGVVVDL